MSWWAITSIFAHYTLMKEEGEEEEEEELGWVDGQLPLFSPIRHSWKKKKREKNLTFSLIYGSKWLGWFDGQLPLFSPITYAWKKKKKKKYWDELMGNYLYLKGCYRTEFSIYGHWTLVFIVCRTIISSEEELGWVDGQLPLFSPITHSWKIVDENRFAVI